MAKSERMESAGESPLPQPTASDLKPENELPLFKSPPLSPAAPAPATDVGPPPIDVVEMPQPPRERFKMPELPRFSFKMPELPAIAMPQIKMPHLSMPSLDLWRFNTNLTRRRKRYAVLAATVMLAAGLGAVIGAAASGGFARPAAPSSVVDLKERKAMQEIIARLTKDIDALKASLAANKAAQSRLAKASDKMIDKPVTKPAEKIASKSVEAPARQAEGDVTGSIPPTPLPLPRPPIAGSAERAPVVKDWSIRFVRDGYVYVQSRGDVYEVVPGAPLPGLGPVRSIKQQDGHWVVATPKGLIVSQHDRKFFE